MYVGMYVCMYVMYVCILEKWAQPPGRFELSKGILK